MRARLLRWLVPLFFGAVVLGAWEGFVKWRRIKPFVLPPPSRIWQELVDNRKGIWEVTKHTGANALIGILVGVITGVAVALVAQRRPGLGSAITPLSAAMNTMPIVALGPIFYDLFGTTSAIPRRAVVATVVFFPIFLNVLKGLTQTEATHLEMFRSYAATDGDVLRKLRLPNALPFLMTGLKLAASLGVIAAIVVEYFGGLQNGLGSRVTSAMTSSATARGWAYIVGACGLGITFYIVASLIERLAMPWRRRRLSS